MKQGIAYLVGAIVIGFVIFHFFTGEGEKEFKLQQKAIKEVKSWKIRTQISSNGRLLLDRRHEANCPDQEYISESGGYQSGEYTRIGDNMYWRRDRGVWTEGKSPNDLFQPFPTPRPCMTNPAEFARETNGIDEMQQYLQTVIDQGNFTKGELQTVGKDQCRDWTVQALNERRQLVATTFCINETDHLPRRMQSAGEAFTITYDWNVPVTVEKPDLAPPIPVQQDQNPS